MGEDRKSDGRKDGRKERRTDVQRQTNIPPHSAGDNKTYLAFLVYSFRIDCDKQRNAENFQQQDSYKSHLLKKWIAKMHK